MKSIRHYFGTIVLVLWVLGLVGVIDFHIHVGLPGTCPLHERAPSVRTA